MERLINQAKRLEMKIAEKDSEYSFKIYKLNCISNIRTEKKFL